MTINQQPEKIRLFIKEIDEYHPKENFRRIEDFLNERTEDPIRRFLADTVIDFRNSYIRHTQIHAATTFSIRNPVLNKTVILEVTGNYALSLGDNVTTVDGTYDGTKMNWIFIRCMDEVTPVYIAEIKTAP